MFSKELESIAVFFLNLWGYVFPDLFPYQIYMNSYTFQKTINYFSLIKFSKKTVILLIYSTCIFVLITFFVKSIEI